MCTHNEYWQWSTSTLGKKRQVLHNVGPVPGLLAYWHSWLKALVAMGPAIRLKPGFQLNATQQRNRLRCVRCINENRKKRKGLRCVRCVNENRKQRKHLIGCFDDWLFRSTIPIVWRLRALRLDGNRILRNVFDCVIFLRLLCYLRIFRFPAKCSRLRCVLCVKLETGLYLCRMLA